MAADEAANDATLGSKLRSGKVESQTIQQFLSAANSIRAALHNLLCVCKCIVSWIIGKSGDNANFLGLASVKDASRQNNVFHNVGANKTLHENRASHVGHKTPIRFANTELGVWVCNTNVGTQCNLAAATQCVAVHCGNHRHRNFLPHPCRLLAKMGNATFLHVASGWGVALLALTRSHSAHGCKV